MHTPQLNWSGEPKASLEQLLNTALPDWRALAESAERLRKQQEPLGIISWAEKAFLRSRRGLVKGGDYDIWQIPGGLSLYSHPGLIQRILKWIFDLLARMLAPYYALKNKLEVMLRQLALRLGVFFSVLGLPLVLLGFLGDIVYLILAFFRSIPSLLLSPLKLLMTLTTLPFQVMMALLSRLFWALLLPWITKILEFTKEDLESLLSRFPWFRGVLLGFLRRNRPPYPVLIPKETVSQVLIAKRRGLFGTKTFLVVVEGDPLNRGFPAWITSVIKHIVLPFYWERTVHILCIPGKAQDHLIQSLCAALNKSVVEWR